MKEKQKYLDEEKKSKKRMVSAITKEVKKQLKRKDKDDEDDDIDGIIMSLQSSNLNQAQGEKPSKKIRIQEEQPITQVSTSALKSILRRVRNTNESD